MLIGIDCEFSFDAENEFYPVCAAVTQEDGETHTWWRDEMGVLKKYLNAHSADTFVAHNVETAEGYLFQHLGLRPTSFRWVDTLLLSRVAWNECSSKHRKHDLASVIKDNLNIDVDEEEKHFNQRICVWEQKNTWVEHLAMLEENKELLLRYCLSDTAHLCGLVTKLSSRMRCVKPLDKADKMPLNRMPRYFGFLSAFASEISWAGIPLDADRVKRLLENAPKAMANAQTKFEKKYPGTFRLVGKRLVKNVAVCREYAEKVYGKNPPRTDKKQISLASEHTKNHKDIDDFLGDYYNLDKKCRALASFSKKDREKNWLGMYIPKRGVVRPRLNMLGTQTGRCGSKPSTGFIYTMGKAFRGLINPPKGFVIVELDYHSEEIGCQAYLSGDKTMAKMYEGPDYYTAIAQRLDPTVKDKHDPKRKKYKVISLMSNYGCGVAHLAEIAGISENEARDVLTNLKKMFKTYWNYVKKCIEMTGAEKDGLCLPLCFSDGFHITCKDDGKVTSIGNWPFQGVGALILRKLLVRMWQEKIRVVAPIHDAIAFMAPEKTWTDVSDKVANIMREVSKECLGKEIDVGEPEVTYHNIPNCHSEFSTREQYATEPPNKYMQEFVSYLGDMPDEQPEPDTMNLYVDEPWLKGEPNG